jgi:SAM-dependent methyltransferase
VSDKTWGEWDGAAEWYDRNMGEQGDPLNRGLLRPLVLEMLGEAAGLTLLDCGCGSGYLTAELATRATHVTGTDFSSAFVALCRSKYGQRANLEFRDHDLTTPMPLAERSVDVVLCKMVLQYVPRIETFARESWRVLREGGRLLVVVDHPFHAQFHYAQRLAGLDQPKYRDLGDYFDPHERVKLSLWGRVELTWYPRTLSTYVRTFLDAGFRLDDLRELPEPGAEVPVPRILALGLGRPA